MDTAYIDGWERAQKNSKQGRLEAIRIERERQKNAQREALQMHLRTLLLALTLLPPGIGILVKEPLSSPHTIGGHMVKELEQYFH